MNNIPPSIKEKVLHTINSSQITPRSRWYFRFKNIGFWSLASLTIILGGLIMSSLIVRMVSIPRMLPPFIPEHIGILHMIYEALPLLWLLLLGLFGYLVYKEIRLTQSGYRYELSILLLVITLASILFGFVFYKIGSGYRVDKFASEYVPFHHDLDDIRGEIWLNPESGFLIGEIESVDESASQFTLIDPHQQQWIVNLENSVPTQERALLSSGKIIGVRGTGDSTEYTFTACVLDDLGSTFFEEESHQKNPQPFEIKNHERKFPEPRNNVCKRRTALTPQ